MTRQQGFWLTFSVLATLLAVTLCAQLPGRITPSWLRSQSRNYGILWPQNWAFFAASPDRPTTFAYQISSRGILTPELIAETTRGNLWGIGQSSYAYFTEAEYLAQEIPPGDWKPCSAAIPSQCRLTFPSARLDDPFVPPLLCGDTLFIEYPPGSAEVSKASASRPKAASEVYISCG